MMLFATINDCAYATAIFPSQSVKLLHADVLSKIIPQGASFV